MTTPTVCIGRIFTADPARPWAEALAVEGERIMDVGDARDVRRRAGGGAPVVELGGRLVLPGFVDAHTHLLMMGQALSTTDLVDALSVQEVQHRLLAARGEHPDAPRLLGRGWLFDAFPDGPSREVLDAVVPDVPVYLDANDLHSALLNSAALAELGVTRDTPDPIGGRIGRDVDGEPTGMLYETAVHDLVWAHLAAVGSDTERDAALDAAVTAYLDAGVTAVVDMAMDADGWATLQRARDAGRLPLRVAAHWLVARTGDEASELAQVSEAARRRDVARDETLRIVGIKIIVDGVVDACTAAMRRPYADGSTADPIWSLEALIPVVTAADAAGLQIALHAIGDAAIDIALSALEEARRRNGALDPGRAPHRIEHLETATPADVARLAALGVTASMQPVHADPAIQENWRAVLGDARAERGYPWSEFAASDALLAFGTDAPTAPHAALPNLFVATTRRSALAPGSPLPANTPQFAVSLAEAIGFATRDAALASGMSDAGMLAPGYRADLVVLDLDPFVEGEDALLRARVLRTLAGGSER